MPASNTPAGVGALDGLVSLVKDIDRARQKRGSGWCPLTESGLIRFRELDDEVCRACVQANIPQPGFEIHRDWRPLGFTRVPSLMGRILFFSPKWEEAMRTLRIRLEVATSNSESAGPSLFDEIMVKLNEPQQAMFRELWEKGFATYARLRELRGLRQVEPDAERKALDRLGDTLTKITDGRVRLEKEPGGVRLVK